LLLKRRPRKPPDCATARPPGSTRTRR